MAHPERVAAAVVASPGWYTFPDPARAYPLGIAPSDELPGVRFEPDAFLRVPVLVTVGADDTDRGGSFRSTHRLDWQGRTRVERALRWVDPMQGAATARGLPERVELVQLEDAVHSFEGNVEEAGLAERASAWLFAPERLARIRPRP